MTSHQLARFIVVGLVTNGVLLGVFWVLVTLGVPPLISVSSVYIIGLAASLILNGKWTFKSLTKQNAPRITVRFVIAYGLGYLYSLAVFWAISHTGVDHTVNQFFVMVSCGALLFLAQKFFVFRIQTPGK